MIEAEALADLVSKLPATRDLIIQEHMALARVIGTWYARRNRRQPDDLISAANLGIVQACQWACEGRLRDLNITPYIVSTVHRFCREAIESDHTVVVARKARRHYVMTRGIPVATQLIDDKGIESPPDARLVYTEIINKFCPRHQAVIEARLAGYTQKEIAEQLRVSQPMVHKYINHIKLTLEFNTNLRDLL